MNHPKKFLQTRLLKLSLCVDCLDMLHEEIEEQKIDILYDLYLCKLKKRYNTKDSDIVVDPYFESGVVKIQQNKIHLMTENEHVACSMLRIENNTNVQSENKEMSYIKRVMKHKKKDRPIYNYGNCDFILGSVAEVEHL